MGIRFAPSPTGRFHLGNLRTAWISWEISRQLKQPWICRFEDIDRPRIAPGAQEEQLKDMALLGMIPDQITLQSAAHERHLSLFMRAIQTQQAYPCFCSRKEVLDTLQGASSAPHQEPPVYNGRCRNFTTTQRTEHPTVAWRFRGLKQDGSQDFILGRTARLREHPRAETPLHPEMLNSFVPSYNWACAIDDYDGNYSLLVRAWDLDHVANQQRAIHRWLSQIESPKPIPAIFHCSLITGVRGERLEKRTRGVTLPELVARGFSIESLLERFRLSFNTEPDFAPEAIRGEAKPTLPINELLPGFLS